LEKVQTRLEKVETGLEKVETRLGKVEYELYGLGKKFRVLNREILDIQNAHEDLEERVSFIDNPSNQQ
jgi:predicted nuclease with TOPRIM domain